MWSPMRPSNQGHRFVLLEEVATPIGRNLLQLSLRPPAGSEIFNALRARQLGGSGNSREFEEMRESQSFKDSMPIGFPRPTHLGSVRNYAFIAYKGDYEDVSRASVPGANGAFG